MLQMKDLTDADQQIQNAMSHFTVMIWSSKEAHAAVYWTPDTRPVLVLTLRQLFPGLGSEGSDWSEGIRTKQIFKVPHILLTVLPWQENAPWNIKDKNQLKFAHNRKDIVLWSSIVYPLPLCQLSTSQVILCSGNSFFFSHNQPCANLGFPLNLTFLCSKNLNTV